MTSNGGETLVSEEALSVEVGRVGDMRTGAMAGRSCVGGERTGVVAEIGRDGEPLSC
jgi:hypothetical protein